MIAYKQPDFIVLKRLFVLAGPYAFHIFSIFLLGLIITPLMLLVPIPLKIVVDNVIGNAPLPISFNIVIPVSISNSKFSLLMLSVFMQIFVILLIHLQSLVLYVLQTYTGERLTLKFREQLFSHIQRLSFSFHDSRGITDSIYRIQYDAPSIQYIIIYGAVPLISSCILLVSMIYVIAKINTQLALIAVGIVPFLFLLFHLYNQRMRPKYKRVKKMESYVINIVHEVMSAFRVVKAFSGEDGEQKRFMHHSNETVKQRIKLAFGEGIFNLFVNLIIAIGAAVVLFIGVINVQDGILTLGELLIVISYLSQLYDPMKGISKQVAALQGSLTSAHRSFELLDEIPDVVEKPHAKSIKHTKGNIEFSNVSFSYDKKNNILQNISFRVLPGTCVGIAGRSGAGKTTLVSLLPRFYDPTSGQILLDDIDLRDYKHIDLRKQFSLVLQEPVLFSTTISENIAYAKHNATEEEIINAAKAANADDFIVNLPDSYDTIVGERGMMLSGGERQRIALARAFLKDAPILIFDEPTSSIDKQSEAVIVDAINRLAKDRTTFIIAHQLKTLETCDMLLVLDNEGTVPTGSSVSVIFKDEIMLRKNDIVNHILKS